MKVFNFYETINDYEYINGKFTFCANLVQMFIDKRFFFEENGEKKYIELKSILGIDDGITYELNDPNCEWDEKTIQMEIDVKIQYTDYLFGSSGIVYDNAVIGIGLEWKAAKSRIKNCERIGFIKKNFTTNFTKVVKINDLNSDLTFQIKFYILEPGHKSGKVSFANQKGLIIGSFDILKLKVDGQASLFPIVEFNDKKGPLWKIETMYTNIYDDEFSDENLKICLNTAHKAYELIQDNHKNFNKLVQSEVLSSAFAAIIAKIINDEEGSIDFNKSCEEGSIVQALKYFKETLKFDIFGDESSLITSIKQFFDKEY